MFELKKYREVIFHDTRERCKIWRKTNLGFGKWNQGLGKFPSEHTTVSKLGLLLGPFKSKFTGELFVMTMKNDAKFEIEVTYQFKIYMRNLTNFDWSILKSQKLAL